MPAPLRSIGVVALSTWRGAYSGRRAVGLGLVAVVYPALIAAIASAHRSTIDLVAASEDLYTLLFLPILLLLVCLVQGVSLFRAEIEDDTIVYPVMRSLPRWYLVAGKYLGFLLAALSILLPAALLGPALGVLLNAGPQVGLEGIGEAMVLMTVLAVVAYGAFFLFLGLLTRQALVIGLVYGFLWETFIPLLPGPLAKVTVIYYLRDLGSHLVAEGPLAGGGGTVGVPGDTAVMVGYALVLLLLAALYLRTAELRAAPTPP